MSLIQLFVLVPACILVIAVRYTITDKDMESY